MSAELGQLQRFETQGGGHTVRLGFEDFALDTERRELRRGATLVAVQPQVFDVLACLVANRAKVVSRDNLIEEVWGGRIVSESTLTTRIASARRAIGDTGEAQRLIRTIHGRGFRFVAEVAEIASQAESAPAVQIGIKAWSPDDRLPIAVLPFEGLTSDPESESLAAGLTQDLIAALCRVPELLIIAHYAVKDFRNRPVSLDTVGDTLGVRHVINGSLQVRAGVVRVVVQLVEAATGKHLWGGRFDRPARDFFAMQDDIVGLVLLALESKLVTAELKRKQNVGFGLAVRSLRRATNLEAWLLHGEAMAVLWASAHEAGARVRELAEAARDLDPAWPDPWANLAWSYWYEAREELLSRDEAVRRGTPYAEKVVELDPRHPWGHNQLSNLAQLSGDHDRAIALREKAVGLAPSDFGTLFGFGLILLRAGHAHRSVAALNSALQVCPRPPAGLIWGIIEAKLAAGDPAAAVAMVDRMDPANLDRDRHYAVAAIAYSAVGRMDDARRVTSQALQLYPNFAALDWRRTHADYRDQHHIAEMTELLVAAGLPRCSAGTGVSATR